MKRNLGLWILLVLGHAFTVNVLSAGENEAKDLKLSGDWPMLGGGPQRNMVREQPWNLPDRWDVETGTNIKWSVQLGSKAYGGPVIAGGKIFIGTNNDEPRNPKIKGDKGIMMCFRESDGKFLWQAVHDKLPQGRVNDWPHEGVASYPVVEGNRLYYVSNRAELVCADVEGDGKGGAKFYWTLDMIRQLNVFPHNLAVSSPLILGEIVYLVTGNGVAADHINLPSPKAPSFLAVNKRTGRVVWSSNAPGTNIMHAQWSSPTLAWIDGRPQIIFPGGDGWLYAFEPAKGKLLWKFDCNPKDAVYILGGKGTKNDFIAPVVVCKGHLYIGVGQDPEHNKGVGHLWCVDLVKATTAAQKAKDRDVSPTLLRTPAQRKEKPKIVPNPNSALAWHFGGPVKKKDQPAWGRPYYFGRTLSLCTVKDGILYAGEYDGWLHCFDARTGKRHWSQTLHADTWGSPVVADGKVYIGTEGGEVYVFKHGTKKFEPRAVEMEFGCQIRVPTPVANGRLYIATENPCKLYAIESKNKR